MAADLTVDKSVASNDLAMMTLAVTRHATQQSAHMNESRRMRDRKRPARGGHFVMQHEADG
jgi:hypothetical protein